MLKFLKRLLGGSSFSSKFSGEGRLFHLLDPLNAQIKKCLFIDARVTTTAEHIIVENLAYTGEQEDLPGITVPIAREMVLTRYCLRDDEEIVFGFKFNNLNEETKDLFHMLSVEFDFEPVAEEFALAVSYSLHCLSASPSTFSAADMYSLLEVEETEVTQTHLSQQQLAKLRKTTINLPFRDVSGGNTAPSNEEEDEDRLQAVICSQRLMDEVSDLYTEDQVLFISIAELKEFLPNEEKLVSTIPSALFLLIKSPDRIFSFDIVEDGELLMRTIVDSEFQYKVMPNDCRVSWVHHSANAVECWVACTKQSVEALQPMLARILFEVVNQQSLSSVYEPEDEEWIIGLADGDDHRAVASRCELDTKMRAELSKEKPTEFVQHNHCIVVAEEAGMTVLREVHEEFERTLQVSALRNRDGNLIHPKSLVSCPGTDHVYFLEPNSRKVHTFNLERGAIVHEWQSEFPVEKICLESRVQNGLVVGANSKSLFSFDPRISGSRVVACKGYNTRQNFSALAVTPSGGLCAATQKGEVKLFKQVGQIAKTSFPGLGDAIISVDVTNDGCWVLGTTKTYLLLLCVCEGSQTGFVTRLGKKKRRPKKLTLLPTDIAKYQLSELKFTPAKFNRGGREEDFIVTSTGNFLIIWDFAELKKTVDSASFLTCYQVHELGSPALQSEFKEGHSSEVLLADPLSIHLQVLK